jgi:hypothetical protein
VRGTIDLGVWGPVVPNLAYNNFAREVRGEARAARADLHDDDAV